MTIQGSKSAGWLGWLLAAIPLAVGGINLTRRLFDHTLVYPDADRILMDGVFIYDFLRTFPLTAPIEYLVTYYAQYPALSIGYRPPLFPAVEAVFFTAFGPEVWAARLALLAMAVAGGVAWFRLVERAFDRVTATAATALLASLPFIGYWSWVTMAEVPTLAMVLISAYLFYQFVETRAAGYGYAAAVVFALALWTKQTAIFAVLWFLPYILLRWGVVGTLRRPAVWGAGLLFLVLAVPVVAISFMLGDQQVAQSIGGGGAGGGASFFDRFTWEKLAYYWSVLPSQLTWPVLVLAVIGAVWGAWRRDCRIVFFVLGIAATYVFFTSLKHSGLPRYSIFWLPSFCLLAVLPLAYGTERVWRMAAAAVVAVLVAVNLVLSYTVWEPRYVTGLREAAAYVAEHNRTRAVLIHSYSNGTFTYFVRREDPERRLFVLRSGKLFSASSIMPNSRSIVYAESREDLREILGAHGIDLVVADSRDFTNLPIQQEFLEYLDSEDFELVHSIPIESNAPRYEDQSLNVYRFVGRGEVAPAETLRLALPIIGRELHVPLDGGHPRIMALEPPAN